MHSCPAIASSFASRIASKGSNNGEATLLSVAMPQLNPDLFPSSKISESWVTERSWSFVGVIFLMLEANQVTSISWSSSKLRDAIKTIVFTYQLIALFQKLVTG